MPEKISVATFAQEKKRKKFIVVFVGFFVFVVPCTSCVLLAITKKRCLTKHTSAPRNINPKWQDGLLSPDVQVYYIH